MKKFIQVILFFTYFNVSAQTAENITFTDLDGVIHDLYSYLDSGYTVILDFSYEQCGPCRAWSENVGHELWETYGPDGENILRMFFFDVGTSSSDSSLPPEVTVSDDDLLAYAQEWGVGYPLINLPGMNTFPEYPENGYPSLFLICPDFSLTQLGGYGYPYSEMESHIYLQECQGFSLNSNVTLFNETQPSAQTLCDARPIQFEPSISIFESNIILNNDSPSLNSFSIDVFINGLYINTDTFSPPYDDLYNITVTLAPFNVNFNDTITFVCDYPGDTFANDDTVSVIIPGTEINTPSSTSSSLTLEASSSWLYYDIFNAQGQEVLSNQEGTQSFELIPDSCYSIKFINSSHEEATLLDANNHEILSFYAGEFSGNSTPRLYFHVSNNPVGIYEVIEGQRPIDRYFVDLLGKAYRNTDIKPLSEGVYFEVIRYENGHITTKKHYKK